MASLGLQIEPHCFDVIPGDSDSTHLAIFIRRILETELSERSSCKDSSVDLDTMTASFGTIIENQSGPDINACRDAANTVALIRKIPQDGMAESRDNSGRGYGDERDAMWSNGGWRSHVPAELQKAAGNGGGGDVFEDSAGSGDGDDGGDDDASTSAIMSQDRRVMDAFYCHMPGCVRATAGNWPFTRKDNRSMHEIVHHSIKRPLRCRTSGNQNSEPMQEDSSSTTLSTNAPTTDTTSFDDSFGEHASSPNTPIEDAFAADAAVGSSGAADDDLNIQNDLIDLSIFGDFVLDWAT